MVQYNQTSSELALLGAFGDDLAKIAVVLWVSTIYGSGDVAMMDLMLVYDLEGKLQTLDLLVKRRIVRQLTQKLVVWDESST